MFRFYISETQSNRSFRGLKQSAEQPDSQSTEYANQADFERLISILRVTLP